MFETFKNAKVRVSYTPSEAGIKVSIEVEGKYTHTFSPKSKVGKFITELEPKVLENKLIGGTYVFKDGKLLDFRFSDYQGYIRSQDDIEILAEKVGFKDSKELKKAKDVRLLVRSLNNSVIVAIMTTSLVVQVKIFILT